MSQGLQSPGFRAERTGESTVEPIERETGSRPSAMTELGKNIGEWLGRGLVETTEDLVEAFDATAGAPAEKQHAGVDATRPCAPPKASASWFGKASKHCNRCGKASVKVERPACKGCGSTEWNFEGVVDSSEQGFLARAQANATSRAKMMNTMEGSDEPGDQVVAGDVSEALSALNALFQRRELDSAGMGRAYELRGVHLGAGARCLRLATHCAVEMRVHARAHTHTHTHCHTHTHSLTHSLAHALTHLSRPLCLSRGRVRSLTVPLLQESLPGGAEMISLWASCTGLSAFRTVRRSDGMCPRCVRARACEHACMLTVVHAVCTLACVCARTCSPCRRDGLARFFTQVFSASCAPRASPALQERHSTPVKRCHSTRLTK